MNKQHGKRVSRTQTVTKAENTHRFSQSNSKKIPNRKTPSYNGIHKFYFNQFTFINDRLAIEMKRCLEADIIEWMTRGKTTNEKELKP